jgi:hypothetical protein
MSSELAFRAQLILREQRDLYDYWRRCARSSAAPSYNDIDPVSIPFHLLPGISIIEAGEGLMAMRYRLAGTRVREIYGVEVTGRAVFDLDFAAKNDYWRAAYRQVIVDRIPMQGAVRGPVARRDHLVLLWLRLPLIDDFGNIKRVLGYDAALPASFARLDAEEEWETGVEVRRERSNQRCTFESAERGRARNGV